MFQVQQLHKSIKPHLLRRMKEEDVHKLPPKLETIVRVELSPLQKDIYRRILTQNFSTLASSSMAPTLHSSGLSLSRSLYLLESMADAFHLSVNILDHGQAAVYVYLSGFSGQLDPLETLSPKH